MPSDPDDLAALRSSDPTSLGALHDHYFPELYRYAHYRVGDPDVAEDLASEAFVRLLEATAAGAGPRTSLRGWLFGTMRHLVDDHHRRSYAGRSLRLDSRAGDPDQELPLLVEQRLALDDVRAALRTLTADQQHVLALRFGGSYSLEETARLMGRNPNAIKALQFRALSGLRRALEGSTGR